MTRQPESPPAGIRAVLICGATASGKSELAMAIARRRSGIVINADAIQVYSCWRVLTARPGKDDEAELPHALYGHVDKSVHYSVGTWINDVKQVLADNPDRLPIIVGGTGLYFSALTRGLAPIPPIPQAIRERSAAMRAGGDLGRMQDDLRRLDPETAGGLDMKNAARVSRAWEVLHATGWGLSRWHRQPGEPVMPLRQTEPLLVGDDPSRTGARIDARLQRMLRRGVLEECRSLRGDWEPSRPWARAIGAAEFMAHLDGAASLDDTIGKVSVATRQYAKRQRTWFRSRMGGWTRVPAVTQAARTG